MATESNFKNMVLCLTAICLVCSALLAVVYAVTKEPIDAAAQKKTADAISLVLPAFTDAPEEAVVTLDGTSYTYYTATTDSEPVGYAIISSSSGFGGTLQVMVGVTVDGVIYNTSVLSQSETPGLGAKCVDPAFSGQFQNFDPRANTLSVKKDGGDVDAITAATITSRAYCKALNTALEIYNSISGSSIDVVSGATPSSQDVEATEECAEELSEEKVEN